MGSYLATQRDGRILTISINRPEKRNAINRATWNELAAIVQQSGEDPELSVIVIRGAGRKVFSAGRDLSELAPEGDGETAARASAEAADGCWRSIRECPKAVIAMVHGHAMGGGCALALACDLRIAGESARFGIPSAKLGIVFGVRGTAMLVALIGPANAARMLFTGAALDARTACEMGLATIVYPDDRLEEETYRLAGEIAGNAPLAVAGSKKIIQSYLQDPNLAQTEVLTELPIRALLSADHREGVRAFMEKRRPVFRGA